MRRYALLLCLLLLPTVRAAAQVCGAEEPPPAPPPASVVSPVAGVAPVSIALALLAGGIAVVGLLVVARDRGWCIATRRSWSPYLAGAGVGFLATLALAVVGKRLGSAGGYQQLAALAWPDGELFRLVPTGLTWELLGAVGMLAGAFASALTGGELRLRVMPDSQWTVVFGPSVAKRWLLVFVGAAAVELAAGIAGGCIASLAISGGAVAAPGAFVFLAALFAGGVTVTRFIYRKHS